MPLVNLNDYEPLAREKLPRAAFDFIAGGAEDELTLAENRAAFQRVWLRARVLIEVSRVDTSTAVLGQRVDLPVLLAVAGRAGVIRVLDLLKSELERAMGLAGCPTVASIDRSRVVIRGDRH